MHNSADAAQTSRWLRASRRAFLLRDFYTFAKHSGICYSIEEDPYREECDFLESLIPKPMVKGVEPEKTYALFLTPRLTYKTSLIKALTLYTIIKDINTRMILGRATLGMAKNTLAGVRSSLFILPDLADLFGELIDTAESWTTTEVRLGGRTKAMSEPTIDTVGLDTSRTGAHPDFAILDDLVNETNFESETEMQKAETLIVSYFALLERNGTLLITGTRWGDNDIYGWILNENRKEEAKGIKPRWLTYIRGAWKPNGELQFPYVLTRGMLSDLQRTTPPKLFSSWYLNEPRAEGENIFPPSAIRHFEADFYPGVMPQIVLRDAPDALARFGTSLPLYVVITVDPAPTVGPRSDETGIVVTGFGPHDQVLVLRAEGVKMLPTDRLNHLMYLAYTYEPHILALENADLDAVLLQEKIDAAGLHTKVVGFNPKSDRKVLTRSDHMPRGRNTKEAQIEAMEPHLHNMWFLRGATDDLTRQMTAYPYLKHDDVIDAFSISFAFRREVETDGGNLEALFWKHDEEKERREYLREAYPTPTSSKGGRVLANGGPGTPRFLR